MNLRSWLATGAVLCGAVVLSAQVDLGKAAKLRNPAELNEKAPATYKAKFDTTKGAFVVASSQRVGAARRGPVLQPRQERVL